MSEIIKVELETTVTAEIKTKRTFQTMEINAEKGFIAVFYRETKFYAEGETEIIVSENTLSYKPNFETWKISDVGTSTIAALEAELSTDTPN